MTAATPAEAATGDAASGPIHLASSLPQTTEFVAVALTPAAWAQSASEFDLYELRSPGLRIASATCRHIPVTAHTDAAPADVAGITAQVGLWRAGTRIGTVDLAPVAGDVQNLSGDYYFCPGPDEPGRFRLGSTAVTWYDQDHKAATFIDDSTGTMTLKQAQRATLAVSRVGERRTFHSHLSFFYCNWDAAQAFPPGWYHVQQGVKVQLQRRSARGTGVWKWVATHRTTRRGNASFQVRAANTYQYRVMSPATPHSLVAVSATRTK